VDRLFIEDRKVDHFQIWLTKLDWHAKFRGAALIYCGLIEKKISRFRN
jgi:hypothetical protein